MAQLTRDSTFKPALTVHSHSYGDVEDDANEIFASAFVQRTSTGRVVIVGDSGGLGIGPVIGVNESNVPDQAGKTYSGPLERPTAKVYVGLFERPIASNQPVTDADMWKRVYADNNHDVTRDTTKPPLGIMVGINNDASTCTVLISANAASGSVATISAPLGEATLTDGTPLADWVDGAGATPGHDMGTGTKFKNIRWNPNASPAPIAMGFALPFDLDETQDVNVFILAAKELAGGDTPTFTVGAFFQTVGVAYNADANAGGATASDMADTALDVQILALTIVAADVPASTTSAPSMLTLTLAPTAGELGTDDVLLGSVLLVYKTK